MGFVLSWLIDLLGRETGPERAGLLEDVNPALAG
jgi:hypothetical protein